MQLESILVLAPGCRLHPTHDVLLIPEGTLQLNGPTRDVLLRLNGIRSVTAVIDDLLAAYPEATESEVRKDVLEVLARLYERGVVRVRP